MSTTVHVRGSARREPIPEEEPQQSCWCSGRPARQWAPAPEEPAAAADPRVSLDETKEQPEAATVAAGPAAVQPPKWLRAQGVRRIMGEFRAVSEALASSPSSMGALRSVWLPSDNDVNVWRMELSGFDADVPAGVQLNADLDLLADLTAGTHGAHIIMEAVFPTNYPAAPFFLRVVSPRMVMYTGHVTAGGSICIEALTNSGTPGAWQSSFTFEGIVNTVVQNMLHTEVVDIRTASGPGGKTGPLRVNLGRPFEYGGPAMEYSPEAAAAAFQRGMVHHAKHGW